MIGLGINTHAIGTSLSEGVPIVVQDIFRKVCISGTVTQSVPVSGTIAKKVRFSATLRLDC